MSIIEQSVTVGEGGTVAVRVARPAGARVRVIVLEEPDARSLTEEEQFQLAVLATVTDDDAEEDSVWERYLHG